MKEQRQGSATARRRTTVVGVFDDHHLAGQALSELCNAGFCEEQIVVALRGDHESIDQLANSQASYRISNARIDARLDAPPGVDVFYTVLPNFDPGISAGKSCVTPLIGPAAGGAGAGFVGNLLGAGVPEHEARYYRDEWEAGRTVITVASGGRSREAKAILRRHGSYDMISGICTRSIF